jgi:acetyltransferase-like isoleucine patch superfamily enzyme
VNPDLRVVLYGVGSPLVIDAEEACARAGIAIAAGVRNVEGPAHVTAAVRVIERAALTEHELACPFMVALFTPAHRRTAVDDALQAGFRRGAVVVDPTTAVARSATLAAGVFVNAGSVIAGLCRLDEWVLVNRGATVGHHAHLSTYASIGPGVTLCGHTSVGRGAVVAAGSVVLPQVSIGANAVVSAGSVVREDVPANTLVAGNPARVIRTGIAGYKDLAV